jgi:hypothetical protein
MLTCANINCQHAGLDIQYHTCVLCVSGLIYNNTTMNLSDWVSFLAYPIFFGIKGFVVVVCTMNLSVPNLNR